MFRKWKRTVLHLEEVERALDRAEKLAHDISARRQKVAALAYELWKSRGSPEGSPEVDWFQAEQQLQHQSR